MERGTKPMGRSRTACTACARLRCCSGRAWPSRSRRDSGSPWGRWSSTRMPRGTPAPSSPSHGRTARAPSPTSACSGSRTPAACGHRASRPTAGTPPRVAGSGSPGSTVVPPRCRSRPPGARSARPFTSARGSCFEGLNSDPWVAYTSGVDVQTTHLEEHRMRIALLTPAAALVFAACVAPTPGTLRSGPDPVNARYINPGTLAALPGFTHAVKVGPTVYVSGDVSLDSTGQLVGAGDLRAQAAQAFANLATVLRIAGVTPADVAKLTIYVVNAKPTDLDVIRAAAPDFFPQRNSPAGTIVGVQSLPREGLLIAVDATAVARAMILPREERDRYQRP